MYTPFILLVDNFALRFKEQGTADKLASVEYAQRYMNSLSTLQLKENEALDNMEPFNSNKTWLEVANDTVSYCIVLHYSVIH